MLIFPTLTLTVYGIAVSARNRQVRRDPRAETPAAEPVPHTSTFAGPAPALLNWWMRAAHVAVSL